MQFAERVIKTNQLTTERSKNMKKFVAIILTLIIVLSIASLSFADGNMNTPYSLTNKYVYGGAGQAVKTCQMRSEPNSLDFKATNIVWRSGMQESDKNPKFSGHYAGTSTRCTYIKNIAVNKYQKATYTGGSIGTMVDVYMSIASANTTHYMRVTGSGVI